MTYGRASPHWGEGRKKKRERKRSKKRGEGYKDI